MDIILNLKLWFLNKQYQPSLKKVSHKLIVSRRGHSELCSPFIHPLHRLGHIGSGQAYVLQPWTSMTVKEMLDVRIGILLKRFGQDELKVEAVKEL